MVNFCAVINCSSRSDRDSVSFYRIPSEYNSDGKSQVVDELKKERRLKWINALKRSDITGKKIEYFRICSKHFYQGKPAALDDFDNLDWVPCLNLGYERKLDAENIDGRYKRRKLRHVVTVPQEPEEEVCSEGLSSNPTFIDIDVGNMQEMAIGDPDSAKGTTYQELIEENKQIKEENKILREENKRLSEENEKLNEKCEKLKQELESNKFSFEKFEKNPALCKFYTGLSPCKLNIVLKFIEKDLSEDRKVTKFQQLVITLMKLRRNFLFTDLGYRFNIHRTTVSDIFYRVLYVLYVKLSFLVMWPRREDLILTMPQCFRTNFGNTVSVIIDCFEIFSEVPSNKDAAAKLFSIYKHHTTIKFLIAVSPQGTVLAISPAFGGRASDKFITEESNILHNLTPGDVVLADRGFNIREHVDLYMGKLVTPSYLKGKSQLDPIALEDTRKIGNVRVHVERMIGTIKIKFTILHNTVPIEILIKSIYGVPVIDMILKVCCALVNICPSIVAPIDKEK